MFARKKSIRGNPIVDMWTRKELIKEYYKGNPVSVNIEINQRCAGGAYTIMLALLQVNHLRTITFLMKSLKKS